MRPLLLLLAVFCIDPNARALPCMTVNSQFASFGKIVEPAHVIGGPDNRGELPDKIKELKITKEQERQLRTSLGAFYCAPDRLNPEPVLLTAFLAGSSGEIVTAGHGVVDTWGQTRDLSTCFFENFEIPKPKRVYIDAKSPRNKLPNVNPSADNNREDKIRLALNSPIKGAEPFMFADKDDANEPGGEVMMAVAQLDDLKGSGKHPIVGSCRYFSSWNLNDGQGRFRTTCNQDGGGSGSPVLIRRNNQFLVKGIAVQAPLHIRNNLPPSDANSVTNLTIGNDFLM